MASVVPVLLGVFVGLTLGLTGAGGSMVAVPALMLVLGWSLPQAAPVALFAVAASAAFGTWVAWDKTYVRYRAALVMGLIGACMAPVGQQMAAVLPTPLLSLMFAAVMLVVSVRLLRQSLRDPASAAVVRATVAGDGTRAGGAICRLDPQSGRIVWTRRCAGVLGGIGASAGFLTGLLGVGGGFVIVPSLRAATELSMHSAVATSLMTIAITATGAVIAAAIRTPELPWMVALPFVAGALAGMGVARKLAPRIAGPRLQQAFALVTGTIAIGWAARAAALV